MYRIMILLLALLGAASPLLMDSAFKGAALLGVAGLAALALCRASAATRHLVWVFAVAALLVLPVLSASLPGWRVLPRWTAAPAPAPVATSGSVATPAPPALLGAHSPVSPPVIEVADSATRLGAGPRLPRDIRGWLPVAWAAGCALLLARLMAAYWLLWRATGRCAVVQDARLAEMLEAARRRLGVRPLVQVQLDPRRTIPLIWGAWRPRLLLPAEAVEWNDSQLRSVLLHELAHIKRHDLAAQCLLQAACALHWFNPLVWLAAWRLQAEAECACDDLVLASGVRASEYAEHVLRVATQFVPARGTPGAGLAMARPSRLEGRLVAVLNERVNRRGVTRTLMWLALAAGLGVVIPVAMLRAAEDKKSGSGVEDSPAAQASQTPPSEIQARQRSSSVNASRVVAPGPASQSRGSLSSQKKEQVLQLLADEIQAAEGLAKLTREQYQSGRASLDTYLQAEMDVLALKQQRASLEGDTAQAAEPTRSYNFRSGDLHRLQGDTAQAKELIAHEIRLLQELEQVTRQRRESGIGTEADELRVRRQLLSLQRQQAELE